MSEKRVIHVGRDYFEKVDGQAQVTTGASVQGDGASIVQEITPNSSRDDVLQLFSLLHHELSRIELPQEVKDEVDNELRGAEIKVKKDPPDKEGMVQKLHAAVSVLKTAGSLGYEAIALGNMIGKLVQWGGAVWTNLMV